MASCYHHLKSNLKSHTGLSELARQFKKKDVNHDEAVNVESESDMGMGGLFGDDSEEEETPPPTETKTPSKPEETTKEDEPKKEDSPNKEK